MSLWSRRSFIAVRLLGRNGHYPNFDVRTSRHLFAADSEVAWSAVIQPPLPKEWELGEVTVLVPEEVRLFSAITLCESDPWNLPVVTNWNQAHIPIASGQPDLTDAGVYAGLRERALSLRTQQHPGFFQPQSYTIGQIGNRRDAVALLDNIDPRDQLMLAGLARLLGANRLLSAAHEPEEAAISLFISMGAALEYIRLSLPADASGGELPFSAVNEYFRQNFPDGEDLVEYFEASNEERLTAIHPSNRFGKFWAPPLMMSDIYHLRKSLLILYRHILLGELPTG